ncbi:MAG: hypothetical protein AAGB51_06190 [Planctomycetota bacterium]
MPPEPTETLQTTAEVIAELEQLGKPRTAQWLRGRAGGDLPRRERGRALVWYLSEVVALIDAKGHEDDGGTYNKHGGKRPGAGRKKRPCRAPDAQGQATLGDEADNRHDARAILAKGRERVAKGTVPVDAAGGFETVLALSLEDLIMVCRHADATGLTPQHLDMIDRAAQVKARVDETRRKAGTLIQVSEAEAEAMALIGSIRAELLRIPERAFEKLASRVGLDPSQRPAVLEELTQVVRTAAANIVSQQQDRASAARVRAGA